MSTGNTHVWLEVTERRQREFRDRSLKIFHLFCGSESGNWERECKLGGPTPTNQRVSEHPQCVGLASERSSSAPVPPWTSHAPPVASHMHSMYNTPIYFLKHPNATVATYKRRQMKHLKQASETLAKHIKNTSKPL